MAPDSPVNHENLLHVMPAPPVQGPLDLSANARDREQQRVQDGADEQELGEQRRVEHLQDNNVAGIEPHGYHNHHHQLPDNNPRGIFSYLTIISYYYIIRY